MDYASRPWFIVTSAGEPKDVPSDERVTTARGDITDAAQCRKVIDQAWQLGDLVDQQYSLEWFRVVDMIN